jgi:hypothetical protein
MISNLRRGLGATALRYCALMSIAFCASVTSAKASTAGDQTIADVQCVVIGARLSSSSDQRQQASGVTLLVYFLGRVQGRSPNIDLEALIKREAKKMTASDLSDAARRCGTELSAQGAEITKIGKSLSQIGN